MNLVRNTADRALYKRVFVASFFCYLGGWEIRAETLVNVLDNVFNNSTMPSLRPGTSNRIDKEPPPPLVVDIIFQKVNDSHY